MAMPGSQLDPQANQLPRPFADIVAGTLPAVSLAPIVHRQTDEAQEYVVSNFIQLGEAGLGYHELKSNHSVLFNPTKISTEQIDAAEEAGKLYEVAPLVRELGKAVETPSVLPPSDEGARCEARDATLQKIEDLVGRILKRQESEPAPERASLSQEQRAQIIIEFLRDTVEERDKKRATP